MGVQLTKNNNSAVELDSVVSESTEHGLENIHAVSDVMTEIRASDELLSDTIRILLER